MANITFGKKGFNLPTPSSLSTGIDVASAICGVVIAWLTTAAFIPNGISNVISSVLGLLIGIMQVIKPLFGVKTTQSEVPVDQVSSMDTKP